MVEDILTAAAADTDRLIIATEATDPVAEVHTVLAPMRAVGQEVETLMESATITADPFRLRQIISNLVSNAVHHGGSNRAVIGKREGLRYTIEVHDDGPGVPREIEDRLFSRFVHQGEDPLLTGTVGLGLSIAQLLTTHSGGTISYRREGGETVFAITFPLAIDTLSSATIERDTAQQIRAPGH